MRKYKLEDFSKGDEVYQLSNRSQIMVVVNILADKKQITCRWIDKNGGVNRLDFIPEELGKKSDIPPRVQIGTLVR